MSKHGTPAGKRGAMVLWAAMAAACSDITNTPYQPPTDSTDVNSDSNEIDNKHGMLVVPLPDGGWLG